MDYSFKAMIIAGWLMLTLSGCVLTPNLEGIVKETGKGITTVQLANAGKALADTRKIKAKTSQRAVKGMLSIIATLPASERMALSKQFMDTQRAIAKDTLIKGMLWAVALYTAFLFVLMIAVFLFKRYKQLAKKTTKEY